MEQNQPQMSTNPHGESTDAHDPYAALRVPAFRMLLGGRFFVGFGAQMLDVALGWDLYVRTGSAFALGLVGLTLFLPVVSLALFAGQIVDRVSRKHVMLAAQAVLVLSALGLTILSAARGPVPWFYACIFLFGVGSAFTSPASTALLSQVVPPERFASAATWESTAGEVAAIVGPAAGGGLIAVLRGAYLVYAIYVVMGLVGIALVALVRVTRPMQKSAEPISAESLFAGVRFLQRTPILLASITLDLFAVLLGGATTLLPIFALSVLHVGATGLGLLRAAPSVGALLVAVAVAHRPPFQRAGRTLLLVVGGFGLATIVFGVSRSFPLSLLALAALGGLDSISMIIRSTLELSWTPQTLMGRISAITGVFVGASNELGGFESGITAAAFGPVISVVAGGIGTILVVIAVAFVSPQMRKLGRLDRLMEEAAATAFPKLEKELPLTEGAAILDEPTIPPGWTRDVPPPAQDTARR